MFIVGSNFYILLKERSMFQSNFYKMIYLLCKIKEKKREGKREKREKKDFI